MPGDDSLMSQIIQELGYYRNADITGMQILQKCRYYRNAGTEGQTTG